MDDFDALRQVLLPKIESDPHVIAGVGNGYTVHSLYLDTRNMDFYQDKIAGLRNRMKVRIRGYDRIEPQAVVYLEIKRKRGTEVIKQRAPILQNDLSAFLESGDTNRYVFRDQRSDASEHDARQFLFQYHTKTLRPVITMAYEREAFYSRFDSDVRITLDKNLRFFDDATLKSLIQTRPHLYALPGKFILEVKTTVGIPLWLRNILYRMNVHHEALSKYTICVDSHHAAGCSMRHASFPLRLSSDTIIEPQR